MNNTAPSTVYHLRTDTLDSRLWRALFLALIVLECVPFWAFQYIPSQDGPSHLHNAVVLANYGTEPIYQEYYRIRLFSPAGNAFAQYMLAGVVKLTGPHLAEKVFLSGYMILFFLAFRYFLRGLTQYADYVSVFAGILAPNWFFYMGFWNFCVSSSFLLLIVGYYVRHQQRRIGWAPRPLIVLTLGGLIVYMSHAVSWVVWSIAVVALGWPHLSGLLGRRRMSRSLSSAAFQYVLPLCSLLPASIFLVTHVVTMQKGPDCAVETSLRARLWPLYSLSFLPRIAAAEATVVKIVAGTFVVVLCFMVGIILKRRTYNYWSSGLLLLSCACVSLAIIAPDCVGAGGFIHTRLAFYAVLFFVAWVASGLHSWPRSALNVMAAVGCGVALVTFAVRVPVLSKWNDELAAFALIGQDIVPRSTVLSLCLERHEERVNPFIHAVGLLSPRVIIDLSNYEASTDFFTTSFQPEYSPFPALGTLEQLQGAPPAFDISRYERQTKGHVDYVLLYKDVDGDEHAVKSTEVGVIHDQLAAYTLVRSEQFGKVALYRRIRNEGAGGRGR